MAEGGVLILYAEPIPDALEEVSVVHAPTAPPSAPMRLVICSPWMRAPPG